MSALLIRKQEGDFEHILVREVETRVAAHIQLPVGESQRRVVVAMPAGKAALAFETAAPAGWTLPSRGACHRPIMPGAPPRGRCAS